MVNKVKRSTKVPFLIKKRFGLFLIVFKAYYLSFELKSYKINLNNYFERKWLGCFVKDVEKMKQPFI